MVILSFSDSSKFITLKDSEIISLFSSSIFLFNFLLFFSISSSKLSNIWSIDTADSSSLASDSLFSLFLSVNIVPARAISYN